MTGWLLDLRFAIRALARQPGFTITVVGILALAIGAGSAITSVAHGVLVRPLPYAEPERLVELWPADTINKRAALRVDQSMDTLAGATAFATWSLPLTEDGEPEMVSVGRVSARHFDVLGRSAALGRTFRPGEDRPGQDRVAVLGHGLWQRRFGGASDIVGRTVALDGLRFEIVGVMPADHRPLRAGWQLWTPVTFDRADDQDLDGSFYLDLVGRLQPGVTAAQAEAELRTLATALRDERPQRFTNDRVETARIVPLHEHVVGDVRTGLSLLVAAVVSILLITCANIASLSLARGLGRRDELSVRLALGAGRRRLLRLLMTESTLLGAVGGGLGLVTAAWSFDALRLALPSTMPRADELRFDGTSVGIAAVLAVATVLLFGLSPALRLATGAPGTRFAGRGVASGTVDQRRWSAALVVVQIAAAVLLMVAGGLMIRTLGALQRIDLGFEPTGAIAMQITPPTPSYPTFPARLAVWEQVMERVRAAPGVQRAGAIHLLPLAYGNWRFPVRYDGQVLPADAAAGIPLPTVNFRVVDPDYFATLGVSVRRGRPLDARDRADAAPVGLINRALADTFWPDDDPLGQQIWVFGDDDHAFTVVGVVDDIRQDRPQAPASPELYLPLSQSAAYGIHSLVVLVRTDDRPPASMAEALRAAVWSVDPELPIADLRPLDTVVARHADSAHFFSRLLGGFAALALILGMAGTYGVIAQTVEMRRREIGLRIALGADRRQVVQRIVGDGLRLTLLGVGLGLALALAGAPLLGSLLYGVRPADQATYAAVVLAVLAAGLASSALPARRASAIDPAVTLRGDT